MQDILDQIKDAIPEALGALAILVVGWIVARVGAAVVRGTLKRRDVDNKFARWITGKEETEAVPVEKWVSRGVYYLLLLFVLVAFFEALNLTLITEPLNRLLTQLFEYAPRLLGAGLLLLAAWIVASVLKLFVSRALTAAKLDKRLGDQAGLEEEERLPLAQTLGEAVYWLVFLFFLPAVLGALELEGLLEPVQGMVDEILAFLPNLFGAGLILAVGWFMARIVQRVVTNLLAAVGVDRISEQAGVAAALGKQKLSGLIGLIIYVLILIPVLIAALDALEMEAITQPASDMLNTMFGALPALFGAFLVLAIAYVVGRIVAGLVTNLLAGMGFNAILARLGLGKEPQEGERSPSEIVGYLVLVAVMLFAGIEALSLLNFELLAEGLAQFTAFAGQVILGLIVFAFGLYFANLAATTIQATGAAQSGLLAVAARVAILVLAGAMALRQMGLANEIVNMAFTLILGAIAVAVALAFGLGGRDVAARQLEEWVESVKSKQT
jgi:hypothetical protein